MPKTNEVPKLKSCLFKVGLLSFMCNASLILIAKSLFPKSTTLNELTE